MTPYQDIWVQGRVVIQGERPCPLRYNPIRFILYQHSQKEKFNVLDFGANTGFFGLNTAYEFPNCNVTLVDNSDFLPCIMRLNNLPNATHIKEYMSTERIQTLLEENSFDVIYAMSVLHHFENFEEIIDLFRDHAETVIFEVGYPNEEAEFNPERFPDIYSYLQKYNPIQINNHLDHDRPIYYVDKKEKTTFSGKAKSGDGVAGGITLPEINPFVFRKFGTYFFDGTLNIITPEIELKDPVFRQGPHYFHPIYINGFPAYNIRADSTPKYLIEVVSPIQLRSNLLIEDKNRVNISIENKYLEEKL